MTIPGEAAIPLKNRLSISFCIDSLIFGSLPSCLIRHESKCSMIFFHPLGPLEINETHNDLIKTSLFVRIETIVKAIRILSQRVGCNIDTCFEHQLCQGLYIVGVGGGQNNGADQQPEPSQKLRLRSLFNEAIGKCLGTLEVYRCIARHLVDLLHPLVQVFIEYGEFAFMRLAVCPDHLDKWNYVNQIRIGLLNAEQAEIFNGLLERRYTHKCSPVPLLMASDRLQSSCASA